MTAMTGCRHAARWTHWDNRYQQECPACLAFELDEVRQELDEAWQTIEDLDDEVATLEALRDGADGTDTSAPDRPPSRPYTLPADVARRHPLGVSVLDVDTELEEAWLDRLNRLPTLTVISTCAGHPASHEASLPRLGHITARLAHPSLVTRRDLPPRLHVELVAVVAHRATPAPWTLTVSPSGAPLATWFPEAVRYLEGLDETWRRRLRVAHSEG